MDPLFAAYTNALHCAFERLVGMQPVAVCDLPKHMPSKGIYLFSEGRKNLYVGRTNRMRQRLQEHCRERSPHNSAPFCFHLGPSSHWNEVGDVQNRRRA